MNSKNKKQDKTVQAQLKGFVNQSIRFLQICTKPSKDEYFKMLKACLIGLAIMGVIGYLIKLVFIPINNIILGTS